MNKRRRTDVEVDYMTNTFSASEKSNVSFVRGQITLPSLTSAIAVNAYNTHITHSHKSFLISAKLTTNHK